MLRSYAAGAYSVCPGSCLTPILARMISSCSLINSWCLFSLAALTASLDSFTNSLYGIASFK